MTTDNRQKNTVIARTNPQYYNSPFSQFFSNFVLCDGKKKKKFTRRRIIFKSYLLAKFYYTLHVTFIHLYHFS